MYYMTYGNNDYRDYVLAHSLGEWLKPTKYKDKIIGAGGKVRYIYDTAKKAAGDFVSKNVTGTYYKSRMNNANVAKTNFRKAGNVSGMHQAERAWSKNKAGYDRSIAGRVSGAVSKLGVRLNRVRKNLIQRGKDILNRVRTAIGNIRGAIRGKYQDWKLKRKGGAGKGQKLAGVGAGKNDLVARGSGKDPVGSLKSAATGGTTKRMNVSAFRKNTIGGGVASISDEVRRRRLKKGSRRNASGQYVY